MKEFISDLQSFWFWFRFLVNPARKQCENCRNGCSASTGDGWNEPLEYEWNCVKQETVLKSLTDSYENFKGEIDSEYATICPLYDELTDEDRFYDSLY